ncbi:MAG: DUF4825 domain-containing protein [Lysinibacillus sp.]
MKNLKLLVITFVTMLVLNGCYPEEEKKLQEVSWAPYIGTYVGDNSAVAGVAKDVLDVGDSIQSFDLRGQVMGIHYLTDLEMRANEEDQLKEAFLYNAMMSGILVPNAKGYKFTTDNTSIAIDRELLLTEMSTLFKALPKGDDCFNNEIVSGFLKKNEPEIRKLAQDKVYKIRFYEKFQLQQS